MMNPPIKADAVARRVGLLNQLRAGAPMMQALAMKKPTAKPIPGAQEERGESVPDNESKETAHASEPMTAQQHLAKLNYDGRHAISPKVNAPFK
jgi:hypothetical protein